MATATKTNRPKKAAQKLAQAATPATAPSEQNPEPQETIALDLAAAYWQAVAERDQATGEIPAVQLDSVKVAYRGTDARRRTNLVKTLSLEASGRVVTEDGEVDTGMARAVKVLSDALAEVREATNRSERPPHDPVPEAARALTALDRWREDLLAELTDDQRDRVADMMPETDDATQAKVSKALERVSRNVLNGRNGHSGPRTSAADTAAAIRRAVHEAAKPLTFSELADAAGISASTVYSRWHNDNTPGVEATKDAQDVKVFQPKTS